MGPDEGKIIGVVVANVILIVFVIYKCTKKD